MTIEQKTENLSHATQKSAERSSKKDNKYRTYLHEFSSYKGGTSKITTEIRDDFVKLCCISKSAKIAVNGY